MFAPLVTFTAIGLIGLIGLMMMLASSHMQATRIGALERKADAAVMRAEAMMAERAGFPPYVAEAPRYQNREPDDRR